MRLPAVPLLHTERLVRGSGAGVVVLLLAFGVARPARAQECPSPRDRATLEGRLTDRATGLPLQRAAVRLEWAEEAGRPAGGRELETDLAGRFEVCDVRPDVPLRIHVSFYGNRAFEDVDPIGAGGRGSAELTLEAPLMRLGGRVTGEDGRTPVEAAAIHISDGQERLTGDDGRFLFERVPPGSWPLVIEHVAYAPVTDTIRVDIGTSTDIAVRLATNVIALEPITVVVRSLYLERAGFYERAERGMGSYITRDEMDRRNPMLASDVLRGQPGLRLVRREGGPGYGVIGRRNCPYRYFVDGTRVGPTFQIDDLPQDWIEAIEIYRGPSSLPVQFTLPPTQVNASCGVILIWTKNR